MPRLAALLLAAAAVVGGACSGDDGDAGPVTTEARAADDGASSTSTSLDEGPFCENVRALESLGDDDATEPTADAVVAQSEEMLSLVGEIAANVPEGSPPAVEALLDDFRLVAEAIVAAAGDREAAYAALESGQPELWARLADPNAHDEAFTYFAERCGTPLP